MLTLDKVSDLKREVCHWQGPLEALSGRENVSVLRLQSGFNEDDPVSRAVL